MVYIILFFGIGASSSAAILIRLSDADPLIIAGYRMIFASAFLIPYALARHRQETMTLVGSRPVAIVGSGLLLALHFACWISSLSHTSVASSAFLVTTNPIFVGLGAWLILREHIPTRLITGTVVALAGTVWISYGDIAVSEHTLFGNLLAVGGAVALSGHLLLGRSVRQSFSLTPYITVVYSIAAIFLVLVSSLSGESLLGQPMRDLLLFLFLAIGPQLLGHTSFNYALGRMSPSLLVLLMLAEPIASSFLALLVLSEPPSLQSLTGGLIICFGIAIALYEPTRPPRDV
ncbi:TPA: EamA/RhaT family transporter [Candidatus Latescibacteria bacterium]|nr:EamA/RhaT family transporter [Candidatus Latescibacterota bacterium]